MRMARIVQRGSLMRERYEANLRQNAAALLDQQTFLLALQKQTDWKARSLPA